MHNDKYDIIDNEGQGDCLFAVIRDAFAQIGMQTTVTKLRKKLSTQVTPNLFRSYRNEYLSIKEYYDASKATMKDTKKRFDELAHQARSSTDISKAKRALQDAKAVRLAYQEADEKYRSASVVYQDYSIMENTNTFEKFQQVVQTCEFWADEWAISTMERILNIKFILLSSAAYKVGDIAGVLRCSPTDELFEAMTFFKPSFYIITDFTGQHYKLVNYEQTNIFVFEELPYDIKIMVAENCMRGSGGLFNKIPDFLAFRETMKTTSNTSKKSNKSDEQISEITDLALAGLFDDNIIFEFYAMSSHKLPGKGKGEKVSTTDVVQEFTKLNAIPDWRRKLDDLWVAPFNKDGHVWTSVEHYYQAHKFTKSPEFMKEFTVESGSALSKDPAMAKAAGSKDRLYKGKIVRSKQINIDSDFDERADKVYRDALRAKFDQHEDLANILRLTKKAKLVHFYNAGKPPLVASDLMEIRALIKG